MSGPPTSKGNKKLPLEMEHISRWYPLKEPYVQVAPHTAHLSKSKFDSDLRRVSRDLFSLRQRFSSVTLFSVCVLYDTMSALVLNFWVQICPHRIWSDLCGGCAHYCVVDSRDLWICYIMYKLHSGFQKASLLGSAFWGLLVVQCLILTVLFYLP